MENSRRATRAWVESGKRFTLEGQPGATKHEQLRHALIQQIGLLRLSPGDALPSENGLCELYGVSRAVVRQTLEELVNAGIVYRVRGKGSFIASREPGDADPYTLRGLYAGVRDSAAKITSDVLSQKYVRADGNIAASLRQTPGDHVFYLERVRRVDGEPWSWIHSYLPAEYGAFFEGRDMSHESLHSVLNENGVVVLGARRSVEVIPADDEQIRILDLGDFPVVMMLTSLSFDPYRQPVEAFTAYHRGNRSRLEFTIGE